ncbi:respiratory nitrate reductase subunit gamma [Catenulispora subtropica]|uniref:Respiratory nitrate reductase subunit gamma n=1 Tax=Catenulispora subtropica TaxID=450798 RepID=A0ABN2SG58_9ACTN
MNTSTTRILLWGALPYAVLAVVIVGTIWRYRYDKFGWTTRSSQLYESRLLRIASPLFHFGLLFVILGHIGGLLIPQSWTDAAGVSDHTYHLVALVTGSAAGAATLAGIALLVYRRRTTGPVFLATTRNDKLMYVFLGGAIAAGLIATLTNAASLDHNYRQTVSPWLRSLFYLHPDVDLMEKTPGVFQAHILIAFALFALFPFSRLVHAFSAPVGYLFRPYIVYRSRDPKTLGPRAPRRGWERVG